MIKSDWNIFKAKFKNYREYFEWFCYILFCLEFKKENGIFRYKNQAGIETNPIKENLDIIGWQAKFYETSLSSNKKDLLDTLDTCQREYPELNRLILYTNTEWSQSSTKGKSNSRTKIEIEEKAGEYGIILEWRTASYFDSPEVAINNQEIAKYFFTFEKNTIDLINKLDNHSQMILEEIGTSITFGEQIIEFDRSEVIQKIITVVGNQKMFVLSGEGGAGKTAVIKTIYKNNKYKQPIYIFKALEFELSNINLLFDNYNSTDFIKAHEFDDKKLVVIDSAEKLIDLRNPEPLKEFISLLKKNGWTIIFTTRSNYVNDLNVLFIDQYDTNPTRINISIPTKQELLDLSRVYQFTLPKEEKVLELLRNPFYLNEYLKIQESDSEFNLKVFKAKLWDKIIKKGKPNREKIFIDIAKKRANSGQFFVKIDNADKSIVGLLEDGILGVEKGRYFITHDIYEEWALEKMISSEFLNKKKYTEFFTAIGESLPMRRSFRKWITSEIDSEISLGNFIDDALFDEGIPQFWKDEIVVSILLSNSSDSFFYSMDRLLRKNDFSLFRRVLFLIRIACKEIDFKTLEGFKEKSNSISAQYFFTIPQGNGWKSVINFIDKYQQNFNQDDLKIILPVLKDWTSKNKRGIATKQCANFALRNYQELFLSTKSTYKFLVVKADLVQIILDGSIEIKKEISKILGEVLKNKWRRPVDPYYDLTNKIVNKPMESIPLYAAAPNDVLSLLKVLWFEDSKQVIDEFLPSLYSDRNDFGINPKTQREYFPASPHQTPIYWLLTFTFSDTVSFIIDFINETSEIYFNTNTDRDIKKIEVVIQGNSYVQISSSTLWNSYRGNSDVPYVFASILMALEKYLLDTFEETHLKVFEDNLLIILKQSKSVAVSAVVASIVLAHPDELFNVAEVLFSTKEFFLLDHERKIFDSTNINVPMGLGTTQIHDEYRKNSDALEHRKNDLEFQALTYQYFRTRSVSEEEADRRQKVIWNIIDSYYKKLSDEMKVEDKELRLSLTRIDCRKMSPEVEEHEQGFIINFNPEVAPDLKEYSEEYSRYLEKSNAQMNKYLPLKNWAENLLKHRDNKKECEFDENVDLVIQRLQEFLEEDEQMDGNRHLLFRSMPSDLSAVLLENYFDELTPENKDYCSKIILDCLMFPFNGNYSSQFGDGIEVAIKSLPIIIKNVPKFSKEATKVLLATLLNSNFLSNNIRFSGLAADTIREALWEVDEATATAFFVGYFVLKPKLNAEISPLNNKVNNFSTLGKNKIENLTNFMNSQDIFIDKIIKNELDIPSHFDLKTDNLEYISTIYRMINLDFSTESIDELLNNIHEVFFDKFLDDENYSTTEFYLEELYFKERYPELILMLPENKSLDFLYSFLKRISLNTITVDLLNNFIYAEDKLQTGDKFWNVWEMFYDKILELTSKSRDEHYLPEIIRSYLFAEILWSKEVTSWFGFNARGEKFFKDVIREFNISPTILFSFLRILNSVGQVYLSKGIYWIASILKNDNLFSADLEKDTIYLLEEFCKKYIYKYREQLRETPEIKQNTLELLNFLIEKGSVTGYLLRENIL